jgi:lipopolysaccharide transport system permease protein
MNVVVEALWRFRRILYASTRSELHKRYAGSLLGPIWPFLYPLLFLSAYLFLWMVVFNLRFPGMGRLGYVVYVFCGLVPFLFLSEALTSGAVSIRQNMQFIKSVIMPLELVPARAVFIALSSHLVGLLLVVVLSGVNGTLSWRLALLPIVVAVYAAGLVGAAWIAASLGVLVPDVAQVLNIAVMQLMFVSPIAFTPDMVPEKFRLTLSLNPVTYIVDVYRGVLISSYGIPARSAAAFAAMSVVLFATGAALCARFKSLVVDLE